MAGYLIAVGGTGQMVALSYWRITRLWPDVDFANIFHMDMDTLVDYTRQVPTSQHINPLPNNVGGTFGAHFMAQTYADLCHDVLDTLFTQKEQQTDISTGMYGRPPVGSSVLMDALSLHNKGLDGLLTSLKNGNNHTVVVCGSAVGGTGAGGVPTLAQHIDSQLHAAGHRKKVKIYVLYFLKHFTLDHSGANDNSKITNRQLEINAHSGISYLENKIKKGTDGCMLLGLETPPARTYEKVGSQKEHPQMLHLLAGLYAHKLFSEKNNPFKNLDAQAAPAVGRDIRDGRVVVNDLGVAISLGGRKSVNFELLIQLNMTAMDMLVRMARLIRSMPRHAFIPSIPKKLLRNIRQLPEPPEADRKREEELSSRLLDRAAAIDSVLSWHNSLASRQRALSILPVDSPDKMHRFRRRPMPIIRKFCRQLTVWEKEGELSYNELTDQIVRSVYLVLDKQLL